MAQLAFLDLALWPTVYLTALMTALCYAVYATFRARSRVNQLRKMGLPMPEWNWFFGHLLYLKRYVDRYPPDTFIPVAIADMARDFAETDMFYLDLWPFSTPFLCVCDPNAATQATVKHTFPKPHTYKSMFNPIMGGPNLLTQNGKDWKDWRALFNPGFSPGYLLEQVPAVVESVQIFCDKLRERVDTVFCFEEIATRLTMDIIIKVTLDNDLNYQRAPNPLADALRGMINWTHFGNPLYHYHPIRPFVIKYYGNVMNNYVGKVLDERFEEYKQEQIEGVPRRSKSIMSLVLASYMENKQAMGDKSITLDENFIAAATYQIRLFLFAGHDTTTSILVYTYHVLSKHPEILQRMKDEHSAIFGPDPTQTATRLRESPVLLNQLPYTLAVIKETMRLYPPAAANREGVAGAPLNDRHGTQYPTENTIISIVHSALHYNPRIWPRVSEFVPERWLVEPGHELYPPNGAWRTFEQGPRSCIGQGLSLIELRVALVMTIRTFAIQPAYEEWDAMQIKGWFRNLMGVVGADGKEMPRSIKGERAYQVEKGGAHPADGYPCRVTCL